MHARCLGCSSLKVQRLGVPRGCDVADRIDTGEDVFRASAQRLEGGIDPGGPGHVEVAGGVIEIVTGANRFGVCAVLMPGSRRQFDASEFERRGCVGQFASKALQQVCAVLDAQPEGAVSVGIGQRRKIHRFRAGDHRVSNILEAGGVNSRRPGTGNSGVRDIARIMSDIDQIDSFSEVDGVGGL